jgi:hypothetical protein
MSTVAILAIGVAIGTQQRYSASCSWSWLTHDAEGFFTSLLFIVAGVKAFLFLHQLPLICAGMIPISGDARLRTRKESRQTRVDRIVIMHPDAMATAPLDGSQF